MHRAMLTACLPWLAALAVSVLLACFLLRLSHARLQLGRFRQLHRDQAGGVQSLSFVLTLPIFIMIMMFIVQISQVMIGAMVVHYAAFAAARSAIVWIPADLHLIDENEWPNRISSYVPDPNAEHQVFPTIPLCTIGDGPIDGGVTYLIAPGGPKYEKILSAAVLACVPISPSRDTSFSSADSPHLLTTAPPGETSASDARDILEETYRSMMSRSADNPAVSRRLQNKVAYALNNTSIEIRFFHQNSQPPIKMDPDGTYLGPYFVEPRDYEHPWNDLGLEYASNELGWQDLVTVKVTHNLALLPGPGRMLAKPVSSSISQSSSPIQQKGDVYCLPLHAEAAMNLEGEKLVIPYVY